MHYSPLDNDTEKNARQYIPLHYIALKCTTLLLIMTHERNTTVHYTTLKCTTLLFMMTHERMHDSALHYIKMHYSSLHNDK